MYDNLYTALLGYFNPYRDLYTEEFARTGGPPIGGAMGYEDSIQMGYEDGTDMGYEG